MNPSRQVVKQIAIEDTYGRSNTLELAIADLKSEPSICVTVNKALDALYNDFINNIYDTECNIRYDNWLNAYGKAHEDRFTKLIWKIVGTLAVLQRTTMPSFVGMVNGYLPHEVELDRVMCLTELLCLLGKTEVISVDHVKGKLVYLHSMYSLEDEVYEAIQEKMYLPPMLVKPRTITGNKDNAYLLNQHSRVVLGGKYKFVKQRLNVEHLNRCNSVPYELEQRVIDNVVESSKKPLITKQQRDNWKQHITDSKKVYALLKDEVFYFEHRPDSRERCYCSGYHVNYQGTGYKKASINFANKEIVPV